MNRLILCFCCYMGLGLVYKVFDQTNAMLALSSAFQILR